MEYAEPDSAKAAIDELDGKTLDGRELNVEYVGQKPPMSFDLDRRRPNRERMDHRDEDRGRARNGRYRDDHDDT